MNRMMRIIAAGFALSVVTTLNADTFTWTGGANDNKLASGANWDVGKSPSDGAALVFNSTSALTLPNAGWRVKAKLEGGALALRVIRPPFVLLVR